MIEYLFYILFAHRITAKDLIPLKKRIRSLKMEWWEAGDLQFYMYVNEHQKWPLQNMYYTSLLVNTQPRSMISHIKIVSPRNIPLGTSSLSHHVTSPVEAGQVRVLRLVANAVTKLWSKHPVHLNMKARVHFQIHDYYRNSISIKCTVKCCSSRFLLLLITRTQQAPEVYQLLDSELISSSASPPWFEAQTRFTYRCLKID